MVASYHRRDISDKAWALIEPYTIGNKGTWGGNAKDTRLFINAVFWILRTGAPWCDLPPDYCNWNTVQRRFCRWRDKGIGETILEAIVDGPDFECCKTLADSRLEQVVSGHFVKRQKRRRRKGLRTFRPVSARGDSNRPKVQIKPRSCVKSLRSCAFARSQARKQRPRQHR